MKKETKSMKTCKETRGCNCIMCNYPRCFYLCWFIGMKTVNVSSFDISIASTESLMLSLDGENWDYEVNINEEKL